MAAMAVSFCGYECPDLADCGISANWRFRPFAAADGWPLWRQMFRRVVVSRRRPRTKQTEHFVHGVDDDPRLVQLNLVTW